MSTKFQNPWLGSAAAGTNYAFYTMGEEDDNFHEGTKNTIFRDKWTKFSPSHKAMILQTLGNPGAGRPMTCNLLKNPDYLGKTYLGTFAPGIAGNTEQGVQEASYVNALGFVQIVKAQILLGANVLFSTNGHIMLVLSDLYGHTKRIANMIGYCKTKGELIARSKRDQYLFAPLLGMPIQEGPQKWLQVGSFAYHPVQALIQTKSLNELYRNYGLAEGSTVIALPKVIRTNALLQPSDIEHVLATNNAWVSWEERTALLHGSKETLYKEINIAAEQQIQKSDVPQRVSIDLTMRGCTTFAAVTLQSQDDIDSGNLTRLCQPSGEDWISDIMLITGTTAREDGLPAQFYRTVKCVEAFKECPNRHIYVFSFEHDAHSSQPNGHQNFTNADGLKLQMMVAPHASPLWCTVIYSSYNGFFTETGTGGKSWA